MNSRRLGFSDINWLLLAIVGLIAVLGVYNLHSAAHSKDPTLYLTQMAWFGVGGLVVIVIMIPDYHLSENMAYFIYAMVCLLLVAVLFGGEMAGGARRWLRIGPIKFQPSELAKIATILCLARYFSTRVRERGYSLIRLFRPMNVSRPIASMVVVVACWDKPWFADPSGFLARSVREQLGGEAIIMGESLWLRIGLLGFVVGCWVLVSVAVVRFAGNQALLNPWPPGRRRNFLLGIGMLALASTGVLLWNWDSSLLRDPVAGVLFYLNEAAAPGGIYEAYDEGMTLRLLFGGLTVGYLVAALALSRRYRGPGADLVLAPIDLLALPALLVLVEPDLGTAGIIILIGMTMIFVVGVKIASLIRLGVLGTMFAGLSWFAVLKDYQKRRILTFIDPESDIQGAGWNAFQSMIAVGSGRLWGKGHQGGTQTQLSFLPEQHTDFAFSVWAEEMGLVGCSLLLLLYLLLLIVSLAIAADARDTYGSLVAVGVAALILWQTLINVGMVIGVAPVVGLTLPLFSYGGSSLLTTMCGLGLLLNVHFRRRAV